ncbi:MAG: SDR family oxidoreductase [Planctomycetes bacterium]|nr:SDR family oxidoreductase [Planctomycetota bacterium]MBI3835082.1 SDR family oxidoreductase [Planctomycetota bacterium]
MRVLVTGAAGFLGSHLCDRLIAEGHHVVGADNFFTGDERNIAHLRDRREFEFIRHDIVEPLYVDVDWIFNLACPASPVHYQSNPVKTVKTSVLGTLHMLGIAKRTKARILQASTSEVYGDPHVHPQPETYLGNVNTIGPRACYDEGKRVAETLMMDYHREHKIDTRIIRIFNTYGPRMAVGDGRVISNFIVQALQDKPLTVYGTGAQTRCFCYVDDMIEGIVGLMKYAGTDAHEPVNVGGTDERSMNEIVTCLGEILGRKLRVDSRPLPGDDPERRRPDCTRARERLHWGPRAELLDGLRRTVEYFRTVL